MRRRRRGHSKLHGEPLGHSRGRSGGESRGRMRRATSHTRRRGHGGARGHPKLAGGIFALSFICKYIGKQCRVRHKSGCGRTTSVPVVAR